MTPFEEKCLALLSDIRDAVVKKPRKTLITEVTLTPAEQQLLAKLDDHETY